ncbi:TadE/TadG family type IV pilus assembly protein [Roseinatronobacter alkalisoli]|uniref:Pilus assembly protein TadG-related protein n=1 Tax=Roseinatronobacter alkalisoli TaxID=3028235 RepID=A0ABT5T8A8_9RHOB|nr:TadE/TadG family type IV pilus assembly protein [Roseinatronobacter sp. HJB301]MDD7971367.1 pilus assembly protein TadG-related protein [Roseinatronobacter sp. HJB301]
MLGKIRPPHAVLSFRHRLALFRQAEEGAILIFGLFAFVIMLMVGGIAVDLMRYEAHRVHMQGTADRAVLAAAMLRDNPANPNPRDIVQAYFDAEGLGDHVRADGRITVEQSNTQGRTVTVIPEGHLNTFFMRWSGVNTLDMSTPAAASEGLAMVDIEIVMVLDVSGSMMQHNRMENLRAAAIDFVEEMLADSQNGNVAITFVPYSTEVIMPAGTLGYFNNLADPHSGSMHNAFCIDFSTWDSVTDSINAPMFRRNCDLGSNTSYLITDMPIRPYVRDVSTATNYINALGPNWGTSIDLGVRAGAMFFDPTLRPIINHLIDNGQVDSIFANRPHDWDRPAIARAMILMTDGENCCFTAGHAATRKPNVEIQDADTVSVCNALKAQNVHIYGVAFEAPAGGVALMENCASSPNHFFNSSGADLIAAFQSIATHVQTFSLRLTQ